MGRLEKAIPRQHYAEFEQQEKKNKEAYDLVKQGKVSDSVKLFRENVDWSQKALGKEHAATLYYKETLAFYLNELKAYKEAAELDGQVLEVITRIEGLSPPSMQLLETQRNLANDYRGMKDMKKAAEIYGKNYELRKKQLGLGEDNIDTLRVGHDLAYCWHQLKEFKKAKDLNTKILASKVRLKMPELDIILSREALAFNHIELGGFEMAETLYLENINALKVMKGKNAYPKILANNEKSLKQVIKKKQNQKKLENSSNESGPKKEKSGKEPAGGEQTKPKEDGKQFSKAPEKQKNTDKDSKEKGPDKPPLQDRELKKPGEQVENATSSSQADSNNKPKAEKGKQTQNNTLSPIPIPTINAPVNIQERALSRSVPDQTKRRSLDLGNRKENQDTPRRVKSQHGRPERKFEFRHIKSSEALSEVGGQSKDGGSDRESIHGPIPGSIAGSWRINPADLHVPLAHRPGGLHPWHTTTPPANTTETQDSVSPPRAPSPARSVSDTKRYGQLFDAEEGRYDEDSTRSVDNWFKLLTEETQALLDSNRKNQCKRVKIAILDTGVDLKHPDFADDQAKPIAERRIKRLWDFIDDKNHGIDSCGHGTHCVGLLRTVAPWADVYVARVAKDFDGEIDPLVVAKAISRASGAGVDSDGKKRWNVDIISLSLGFYGGSKAIQSAIQEAINNNTLIFAAASNGGTQKDMTFPAWLEGVVCVNCAYANGKPTGFNPPMKGANNFSILGVNVKSAWIREEGKEPYRRMSGTSVATPIAAGVAALVLEFALQNDPDSFMKDLDYLKHYNGMTEVFAAMSNMIDDYRNIVPWKVLKERFGRPTVKSLIEVAIWQFQGPS